MDGVSFQKGGAVLMMAFALCAAPAMAQDAEEEIAGEPSLFLELNTLQSTERGCRFTFLATNDLGAELTRAAFELAIFNEAGMISRVATIDFRDMPEGKSKVRQFDFPGIDCDDVGRVLVNDATECAGDGLDAQSCIRALQAETRSEVLFGT